MYLVQQSSFLLSPTPSRNRYFIHQHHEHQHNKRSDPEEPPPSAPRRDPQPRAPSALRRLDPAARPPDVPGPARHRARAELCRSAPARTGAQQRPQQQERQEEAVRLTRVPPAPPPGQVRGQDAEAEEAGAAQAVLHRLRLSHGGAPPGSEKEDDDEGGGDGTTAEAEVMRYSVGAIIKILMVYHVMCIHCRQFGLAAETSVANAGGTAKTVKSP
ncbi:hypothetical protein PG994_012667 [Apiospora phragmitis]|uniref:Uncharacterized protein n=1 Tax=Apiospora phragmitis TaxID=2905665 RepID=A0ABR1TB39_9PEZI